MQILHFVFVDDMLNLPKKVAFSPHFVQESSNVDRKNPWGLSWCSSTTTPTGCAWVTSLGVSRYLGFLRCWDILGIFFHVSIDKIIYNTYLYYLFVYLYYRSLGHISLSNLRKCEIKEMELNPLLFCGVSFQDRIIIRNTLWSWQIC